MFSKFWRLLGYPTFKYQRISDHSASMLVLKKQPTTVQEVKSVVATSLGIETDQIDVTDKTAILENCQEITNNDDVTEILVHRKSRRIPAGKMTHKEDVFEGSMADGDRVKMSCGHAATPENLYRYCWTKLNSCDLRFKCMECSTTWEFTEIANKADMSDDERLFFSRKMNIVYIDQASDIRSCPKCGTYCTRITSKYLEVSCVVCSKNGQSFSFCWNCNKSWTRNHSCSKQLIQELLENCERVTMEYSNIANVPKVRTCPNCKMYIEHDGGCKTMDCPKCKHTFCFSCLKPKIHGRLACGSYGSRCTVAPVQNISDI